MHTCYDMSYERKHIKDWNVSDYIYALWNQADRYELDGKLDESKVLNDFARTLLYKADRDFNLGVFNQY